MYDYNDMDAIIEGQLWLGNLKSAKNTQALNDRGIIKVLTVMDHSNLKYELEDGIIHKKVEVVDLGEQNIIQYFGECLNFINGEERVLVHCAAGSSRSGAIVIAYLMWAKRMKYDEASQFVRDKRYIVCPNFGFRDQLKMFEKLLIENDYDINRINFKGIKWPANLSYY